MPTRCLIFFLCENGLRQLFAQDWFLIFQWFDDRLLSRYGLPNTSARGSDFSGVAYCEGAQRLREAVSRWNPSGSHKKMVSLSPGLKLSDRVNTWKRFLNRLCVSFSTRAPYTSWAEKKSLKQHSHHSWQWSRLGDNLSLIVIWVTKKKVSCFKVCSSRSQHPYQCIESRRQFHRCFTGRTWTPRR